MMVVRVDLCFIPSPGKTPTLPSSFHRFREVGSVEETHHYCSSSRHHGPKRNVSIVGFRVPCTSRRAPEVSLPKNVSKAASASRKNNKYGGAVPSILRSLDSEEADADIGRTLSLCGGRHLNPKQQTVILKEQTRWERVVAVFDWMKSQGDYSPNVIHYNVVLRALGMAQKWDELRRCWMEMGRDGVLPTNNTYGMLVDVYGKAGLVKESLMWIRHMESRGIFPDEVTMNTAVRVLKEARHFERAERFYRDWRAGKVGLELEEGLDLDSMPDSACGSSDLDSNSLKQFLSTQLFRAGGGGGRVVGSSLKDKPTSQKPRRTATYNTLIDLYGKAGRLKDAADTFSEMLKSGVPVDATTYNTMIFICGSSGRLSEAESLLKKMEERGVFPDTKTYNIFLSLYADAGDIVAALRCYREIRKVGLAPDTVTYRAVLQILCERNMASEVGVVIEEMERSGVNVDEKSLPVVTKMYVGAGLLEEAKTFLGKCQSLPRLSSKTCAAIIDVYAEKGFWTEAEALFMRKWGLGGCRSRDVVEYNVMIKAYGKAKLYEKALSLFHGMKHQGTWPDDCTYNSLIQMLSGGDLADQARNLLAEMQAGGLRSQCSTFSAVIASCARLGRLSDAVDVFQEMERAGLESNEFVFGSLIDGFAESGKVEEAFRYFRLMEERGVAANQIVLTSLIKAYGKLGSLEEAILLYEKMKNLKGGVDLVASNSMINLCAELGMVSEAKSIFNSLREKGSADSVSFATMIYLYKNMGMLAEAIEVADEMKRSGLLNDCTSFNKVMACYATNGQLRDCGELLHEMLSRKILPDSGTFKILFTILKKRDLPIEAVAQLESSYREGKPYARHAVMTYVFCTVGLHVLGVGSCETFRNLEHGPESYVYNAAIYAYGASGEIDKALNMFMKMQDEGLEPDLVTFINLVGCYGKAGMIEGVKRIYSKLKFGDIEPSESLYKAIMDAYKSANRHDLAEVVNQEIRLSFEAQSYPNSELNMLQSSSDCICSSALPDADLDYTNTLKETKKLFHKLYPDEEFFPKTPLSEDLNDLES